jgi:hypothetical protein
MFVSGRPLKEVDAFVSMSTATQLGRTLGRGMPFFSSCQYYGGHILGQDVYRPRRGTHEDPAKCLGYTEYGYQRSMQVLLRRN